MRFRLALAFLISVLFIGVASWSRFGITDYVQPSIVAVEQSGTSDVYNGEILRDFTEPGATSTTPGETSLSNTDLVGRELILDYVSLAASGQATEVNIATLANQYVESIPMLNKATVISAADIKTMTNTKVNFQNYADVLTKIHTEYTERIGKAYAGESSISNLGPELYSFASTFSAAYTDAALKLKNLPVPTSLASIHLQLVNSYLSSASAMKAVSETEQDAAAAFAGLIMLNKNLDKEDVILTEISRILSSNGI